VKLRVSDRAAVLRRLRKLRARGSARMHEMNTLYDAPDGSLFREGKLVRIRTLRPAGSRAPAGGAAGRGGKRDAILTDKGPVRGADGSAGQGDRCKIREEHELAVEDAAAMARVFEGMGLRPSFRYEKYRTTYQIPRVAGLLVEMDETPIGDFLELEGEAGAIDRVAATLGYQPADYITESYGALFFRQRRAAGGEAATSRSPADMLFPKNGRRTAP